MKTRITLKNFPDKTVDNLTLIKRFNLNESVSEITDFTSFFLSNNPFVFVGDIVLAINGDEIVSVEFN